VNGVLGRIERFLHGLGEGTSLFLEALYWC